MFTHRYLYWFLDDVPGTVCPFGGKAAYRDAVRLTQTGEDGDGYPVWEVRSCNFMVFHTILRLGTSRDRKVIT